MTTHVIQFVQRNLLGLCLDYIRKFTKNFWPSSKSPILISNLKKNLEFFDLVFSFIKKKKNCFIYTNFQSHMGNSLKNLDLNPYLKDKELEFETIEKLYLELKGNDSQLSKKTAEAFIVELFNYYSIDAGKAKK